MSSATDSCTKSCQTEKCRQMRNLMACNAGVILLLLIGCSAGGHRELSSKPTREIMHHRCTWSFL
jgi:hypothetical protein